MGQKLLSLLLSRTLLGQLEGWFFILARGGEGGNVSRNDDDNDDDTVKVDPFSLKGNVILASTCGAIFHNQKKNVNFYQILQFLKTFSLTSYK